MKLLLLSLFSMNVCVLFGQTTANVSAGITMPLVALLDIEPSGSVTLNFSNPTEAGNSLGSSATNSSKWLNFSSAVTSGFTRTISAQVSGTVPSGARLSLLASGLTGGDGTRGTAGSAIFLTNSPQNIITGIGGAYTGSGTGSGYNLTYSLNIQNYNLLKSGTYTFSVLFTLSDI